MGGLQGLFAPAHHGRIDNAVADHLDGTVECHQAGGTGRRDRVTRALECEPVADKTSGRTVEAAQKSGVIDGKAAGPEFFHQGCLQLRRHGNVITDALHNIMGINVQGQVFDRARGFARVLGNQHADAFPGDVGIQKSRFW